MRLSKRIIILIILTTLLAGGCKNKDSSKDISLDDTNINDDTNIDKPIDEVKIDIVNEKIKGMSLEEKIGQLIIVGFEGKNINEEVIKFIEDLKVGGFILFSRNIDDENQTLKLLNDIKEANSNNDIPLFLSIDEEGGKVSRLPKSFIKLPESIKVANKNDKDISYEFGKILGERVKILGFNMNFAPVLDINSNPNNPVIGSRAFGITANQVVDNGIQVMLGIRDTGVIPAVKHFPGHGDTDIDSHVNIPKIEKTIEQLKSSELIPFKVAIDKDVEMVMIAHILYPEIDKDYPATMSREVIKGLLRDELGYDGIIVSDDMTMGAIVENYTLEDGVLSFIKAGGDIALICHGKDNPDKAIQKIIGAIRDGELKEEDINKKVYRVLKLKEKHKLKDNIIDEIDLITLNNKTKEVIERIKK